MVTLGDAAAAAAASEAPPDAGLPYLVVALEAASRNGQLTAMTFRIEVAAQTVPERYAILDKLYGAMQTLALAGRLYRGRDMRHDAASGRPHFRVRYEVAHAASQTGAETMKHIQMEGVLADGQTRNS